MSNDAEHGLDQLELIAMDHAQASARTRELLTRRRELIVRLLVRGVPYARIRERLERPECGQPCTDRRRHQLEARLRKEAERHRGRVRR